MNKPTDLESFIKAIQEFKQQRAEIEAKKTPEQRERERVQYEAFIEQRRQEKAMRQHKEKLVFYKDWIKRDTWTLQEGLDLLLDNDPTERQSWLYFDFEDDGYPELLELAISCIGVSLQPKTEGEKPEDYRFTKEQFIKWAKTKTINIPEALLEALGQSQPRQTKNQAANQKRGNRKQQRLDKLDQFLTEMERRAKSSGERWDRSCIPVTKQQFYDIFFQVCTDIETCRLATLADDIAKFHGKFKPGTGKSTDNVLEMLFKDNSHA